MVWDRAVLEAMMRVRNEMMIELNPSRIRLSENLNKVEKLVSEAWSVFFLWTVISRQRRLPWSIEFDAHIPESGRSHVNKVDSSCRSSSTGGYPEKGDTS